ncbi:hypothetical protein KGM_213965B, partial [Danaus plexippus plexippus]
VVLETDFAIEEDDDEDSKDKYDN